MGVFELPIHAPRQLAQVGQTDADRERVVDSLTNANEAGSTAPELSALIRRLGQRWFLVRNVHATDTTLLEPRWAMSFSRGPMTPGIKAGAGRFTPQPHQVQNERRRRPSLQDWLQQPPFDVGLKRGTAGA